MEPVFQTSFVGNKVSVYQDRVVYRPFFGAGGEHIIPIKQIASVDLPLGFARVDAETTSGKSYQMLVRMKDRKPLRDAILQLLR